MSSPSASPSILVVDDDEGLLILMSETLRGEGYDVLAASSAKAARAELGRHAPALMILDLKLQDGSGPELVASLRDQRPGVPFIVVTGQGDEKVAVEVMKQGALDYVMKDTGLLDLLPSVVRRALGQVASEHALANAQEERKRLEGEILAVGERERLTIGADLHDNLGQQLTALELMCTALKEEAAAAHLPLARGLDRMGRLLREAISQTRYLARGLVPVGEDPDALQIGLAELAERTNGLGRVKCRFECPQPITPPERAAAGHLYRIAQEAVNNAMKHARGRHVTIRLSESAEALQLEIIDDGAGITKVRPASATEAPGIGLGVMQHRAQVIGAQLEVVSKRGEGVTIRCTLPRRKK